MGGEGPCGPPQNVEQTRVIVGTSTVDLGDVPVAPDWSQFAPVCPSWSQTGPSLPQSIPVCPSCPHCPPDQKPDVVYADIGGMDIQKQEVREAVELPLTHFELYKQIGIDPPRGVLMYGPPGCGKTMLAKAVAHLGTLRWPWGPARCPLPQIGIDPPRGVLMYGPPGCGKTMLAKAVAHHTTGVEFGVRNLLENLGMKLSNTWVEFGVTWMKFGVLGGICGFGWDLGFWVESPNPLSQNLRFSPQADREVQRILLELLNQMDGFDQNVNVKVIMATNRADTLDPALLRPGRLDRKIEFPLPDRRQKRLIFSTITGKMNLSEEVDLEDYVARPDKISGADINSICQEGGMLAVRENRYIVLAKDFEKAYKTVIKKDEQEHEFYK
ncbi:26S proteasome regulatory subunit 6B-like [Passer montanus]|uniref:26S proteasome regulatory subunit 6B-like n=1 Tax=Passer montanus TaxID=9160 RepID=UPI00195F8E56|nr:26S proteasome regulatory subunit 6B-like [Passer montanus]